jgi:small-conductance mechanosensitive channel
MFLCLYVSMLKRQYLDGFYALIHLYIELLLAGHVWALCLYMVWHIKETYVVCLYVCMLVCKYVKKTVFRWVLWVLYTYTLIHL